MTTLTFYGAAGTVTGSCSCLDTGSARVLLDCGMFQGNRTVRALNDGPFPFDARSIDALVLTHAHIDHSGLVPKLVRAGFDGPIHATRATEELLSFLLRDAAHIQESNAERDSRKRQRRGGDPVEPIYTMEDAERSLDLLVAHDYEEWFEPAGSIESRFWNAGHILGSSSVELRSDDASTGNVMRVLFSGDVGPDEKVFHPDPDAPEGFDYVVCESTYGARSREDSTIEERRAVLRRELARGLDRGGNVVVPSFAVERSQELLHDIGVLLARDEIDADAVYLDSPLARRVTSVFASHAHELEDLDVAPERLFRDRRFHIVESVDESKAINRVESGAIIVSASGMCEAGRILHHLKSNVWRPEATVLFVGFQAPGTLGRILLDGARDVRIHGKEFRVRAEVRSIEGYSAHADREELVEWIAERAPVAGGLFLNHGEDDARVALRDALVARGLAADRIHLPSFDEEFELVAGAARTKGRAPARIPDDELERDWDNDRAAFLGDLTRRLEELEDDAARRELIRRLSAELARDAG